MKWISILTLILSISLLSACEDKDNDKLAEAQQCLDRITDANYEDAQDCMSYVEGVNSQQADIIRCSASFLAGGLTTSKILDAYEEYEAAENEDLKTAILISALALDDPKDADAANDYCQDTGLDGFIYLGNLCVMGTTLKEVGNFSNPPTEQEVQDAIESCQANPEDCVDMAPAIVNLADTYCGGTSSDEEICQDITSVIAEANGNEDTIAEAMACYLGGGTFEKGTCTQD